MFHFERFRPSTMGTDALKPLDLNPESRTHDRALSKLQKRIVASRRIVPIVVAYHKGKYVVVDGNRRLKIAKTLGHKSIDCLIADVDSREELQDLFSALNEHLNFNGKQYLEMILNDDYYMNEKQKAYRDELVQIFGNDEILQLIQDNNQSLKNVVDRFHTLQSYIDLQPEEEQTALLWMVVHHQTQNIKNFSNFDTPPAEVRDAIKRNVRWIPKRKR